MFFQKTLEYGALINVSISLLWFGQKNLLSITILIITISTCFFFCSLLFYFHMFFQSFLSNINLIFRSLKLKVSLDLSIYSVHE